MGRFKTCFRYGKAFSFPGIRKTVFSGVLRAPIEAAAGFDIEDVLSVNDFPFSDTDN